MSRLERSSKRRSDLEFGSKGPEGIRGEGYNPMRSSSNERFDSSISSELRDLKLWLDSIDLSDIEVTTKSMLDSKLDELESLTKSYSIKDIRKRINDLGELSKDEELDLINHIDSKINKIKEKIIYTNKDEIQIENKDNLEEKSKDSNYNRFFENLRDGVQSSDFVTEQDITEDTLEISKEIKDEKQNDEYSI